MQGKHRISNTYLPFLAVILAAASVMTLPAMTCSTRSVTSSGVPVTDTQIIAAANVIASSEQMFVSTGELLLASRGSFSDERWAEIADTSQAVSDGLFLARNALKNYELAATPENADTLTKSLNVLQSLSTAYAAYKGGV